MPPSPIVVNPMLPPEIERIIGKALEKDRELRYQTAANLKAKYSPPAAHARRASRGCDDGAPTGGWASPAWSRTQSGGWPAAPNTVRSSCPPWATSCPVRVPPLFAPSNDRRHRRRPLVTPRSGPRAQAQASRCRCFVAACLREPPANAVMSRPHRCASSCCGGGSSIEAARARRRARGVPAEHLPMRSTQGVPLGHVHVPFDAAQHRARLISSCELHACGRTAPPVHRRHGLHAYQRAPRQALQLFLMVPLRSTTTPAPALFSSPFVHQPRCRGLTAWR